MTINELLKNNPECGDLPLYLDTTDAYIALVDAYGGGDYSGKRILLLKAEHEIELASGETEC